MKVLGDPCLPSASGRFVEFADVLSGLAKSRRDFTETQFWGESLIWKEGSPFQLSTYCRQRKAVSQL